MAAYCNAGSSRNRYCYINLTAFFQLNRSQLVHLGPSSSVCLSYLWARCRFCHPTVSVKALTLTSVLVLSFLDPWQDCWWKGRSYLYASSVMMVALQVYLVLLLPHHHNRFTAPFLGPPGWTGARRELLDSMLQGKVNGGRRTNHPAGRHSIRTNQCPPPPSFPYFFTNQMPFLPPNQQRQRTEGNASKHWTQSGTTATTITLACWSRSTKLLCARPS